MSIYEKNFNKGEWAEFYVLLKLLGDGRLYMADNMLEKKFDTYLDVLKVIREEAKRGTLEYVVDKDASTIRIQDTAEVLRSHIPSSDFRASAAKLFDGIKAMTGKARPAPASVCSFAEFIYVENPKAPAVKALKKQFGGKNDIFLEVRDSQTALVSVMGFSIKSMLGSAATLFNASTGSQFLYRLTGCDDELMDKFNSIRKGGKREWSSCKSFLAEHGIGVEYVRPQSDTYYQNLLLVRDRLDAVLAWCLKDRFIDATGGYEVKETVERLAASNPLQVPNPEAYYEKAVKDFLMAGFTGMTAARDWNGREQVTGGYIVVKDDGDVVCYHSNDRESFRDYLYRNTFFEYVSTKKYQWSYIRKEGGHYYLPLNVSVRFNPSVR